LKFLDSLVEKKPGLYLDELQVTLRNELGIETSVDTICRELKQHGLTRKKVCLPLRICPISISL